MKERRTILDRRLEPRGGRRTSDRPGRAPLVLVADNYDAARRPVALYLHQYGFDVTEATTGDAAVVAVQAGQPRAVLSGLEDDDARLLYLHPRVGRTPVIVLAADGSVPMPPAPAAIVTKPFHLSALLDTLRGVLGTLPRAIA